MLSLKLLHNNCPFQFDIGLDSECFNYELTVTYDPKIFSVTEAWNSRFKFVDELIKWCEPLEEIQTVHIIMEYQKTQMLHFHCNISTSVELTPVFRKGVIGGCVRLAGRSEFKPVHSVPDYEEYLQKDLKRNFDRSQEPHYLIYYR